MRTVYKSGRVRLTGKDLEGLRMACYDRDQGCCCECFHPVSDEFPDWHSEKYHMAHIKSRGAGGSDSLENVTTLCGSCHRKEHAGLLPRRIAYN